MRAGAVGGQLVVRVGGGRNGEEQDDDEGEADLLAHDGVIVAYVRASVEPVVEAWHGATTRRMASELHEPRKRLSELSLDVKRAIDSMREELEAIDWYRQRMQAAASPELAAILDHHQREEVEHFAMLLEWCRRNDADFDGQLRRYLFSQEAILQVEDDESKPSAPVLRVAAPVRTVGSLKEEQ